MNMMSFSESFSYYKPDSWLPIQLAFIIIPRRIPLVKEKSYKEPKKLVGFKYIQYIELYPFSRRHNLSIRDLMKQSLLERYKCDHDCLECFNPDYILPHIPREKRKAVAFSSLDSIVDVKLDEPN